MVGLSWYRLDGLVGGFVGGSGVTQVVGKFEGLEDSRRPKVKDDELCLAPRLTGYSSEALL